MPEYDVQVIPSDFSDKFNAYIVLAGEIGICWIPNFPVADSFTYDLWN